MPVTISAMTTLTNDFADYLRDVRMLRPKTIAAYRHVVARFASFLAKGHGVDDVLLEAVEASEVETFLRGGVVNGHEPSRSAWNNRLSALRSFYGYLFREERITVNPAMRVDRLKLKRRSRVPLSFDEMIRLVDAASASSLGLGTRNAAIVLVLLHNSFRVSELASINTDQVDLQAHTFTNVRTKGGHQLSLAFNDLVCDALENYLDDRRGRENEAALFLSNRGGRMSVRAVQEMVDRAAKRAGIGRKVTPHMLRHSSLTAMAELGTDIYTLKAQAGHADIKTTARYVHLGAGKQRAAVEKMDSAWRERKTGSRAEAEQRES